MICIVNGYFDIFLATLVANWSIFNITQTELDKIAVEWHHHPPVTPPLELSAYAVVCTPTDGKLGPTLTTVRGNINRTEVHRVRRGTNYSVEIVALIYNNQTEEITLQKSQSEGMETDEGGKTILLVTVQCTCIGSHPPSRIKFSVSLYKHFSCLACETLQSEHARVLLARQRGQFFAHINAN